MSVISELRMRPAPVPSRRWDAPVRVRLALAVVVLSALLIGANLATPLYPLIRADLQLSAFDITATFTSYVFVLVAGLLLMGHWSDYIGRRAALVLAVGTGVLGAAVFAAAASLPMLVLARCLQGAAVACATGASAAALRDLLPHRPEWVSRFTLAASAGGVAAGPLIGGMLSLLPGPTRSPFILYGLVLSLLLIPLVALAARPAVNAPAGGPFSVLKPRRPAVSRTAARAFWAAAAVGFLSFSLFGFALSLAPTYFAGITGDAGRPLIGLLAGLVLAASAASQLFPLRVRRPASSGLLLMAAGVVLIPAAGAAGSVALLVLACTLAGAGQGTAFRTVFNELALQVEAAQHAQIISTVYVLTYLGSAVPVLGLGMAVDAVGLVPAVTLFAGTVALGCAVMAALLWCAGGNRRSGQ